MSGAAITLSAKHVAVAIVAACGITGLKPETIFVRSHGSARTRMIAAAALVSRLGASKPAVARLLSLPTTKLSPSQLTASRVTTDHLLTVAEALDAAGLTVGDDARGRVRAPWGAQGDAAAAVPAPVAAKPVRAGRGWMPSGQAYRQTRTAVETLKPVTDRVARWGRQQHDLGADMGFVAWCFGVCPDALTDAVRTRVAA